MKKIEKGTDFFKGRLLCNQNIRYELNTFLTLFNALRCVQVILQKHLGECHWFVYNVDEGMEKQWVVKSIFNNCKNYEISKCVLAGIILIYLFFFKMLIANVCFISQYVGQMIVLNGIIYIFVQPNQSLILGFSIENYGLLEQSLTTHYYPSNLSVSKLKTVIPFYG